MPQREKYDREEQPTAELQKIHAALRRTRSSMQDKIAEWRVQQGGSSPDKNSPESHVKAWSEVTSFAKKTFHETED